MGKEEFLKKMAEKFGEEYDFSTVTDTILKNNTNMPVKCRKHGLFYITPHHLLNGNFACFECYKEKEWGNQEKEL